MIWKRLFPTQKKVQQSTPCYQTKIEDLGNELLSKIFNNLESRDLYRASHVCSRFKNIVDDQFNEKKVLLVRNKEIVYRYNCRQDQVKIHVLKMGRSIAGVNKKSQNNNKNTNLVADSLEDLLAEGITFNGAIVFESNVDVSSAVDELLDFYTKGLVLPRIIRFNGGSIKPVDSGDSFLSNFTQKALVQLVRSMKDSLQEVHMMTSNHVKLSKSPIELLRLCDQLTRFSLVYEQPAIRFTLDDLAQVAERWKKANVTSSCQFFVRRPVFHPATEQEKVQVKGNSCGDLQRVEFTHPNNSATKLTFNFH